MSIQEIRSVRESVRKNNHERWKIFLGNLPDAADGLPLDDRKAIADAVSDAYFIVEKNTDSDRFDDAIAAFDTSMRLYSLARYGKL